MAPSARRPIRTKYLVLIICPHRLIREGLRLMLANDEELEVVGVTPDVDEALDLITRSQPDVIILSPGGDNCRTSIKRLSSDWPSIPVLVVSPAMSPENIQAVLQAGATGYLPMDATINEFICAVFTVGRGEQTIHPTILLELLSYLSNQKAESEYAELEDLSPREQEVLSYLARGLSDRDIAQELFISVRTVQTHLSRIYTKLGVHSRIEAALIAVQRGWFLTQADEFEDSENK